MGRAKVGGTMTPNQLWTAIELRYPKREYALLAQVRNSTGFARQVRTADALALSLWPSRGILLHGIEIKSYRGDWIREKDAPEKAEEIARFCDYWWLAVTNASIAPLEEVPPAWGVLGPNEDASRLVVIRDATKLDAQSWSRGFMAAMLRNASDSSVPAAAVHAQNEEAYRKGVERGESQAADIKELTRLREMEADVIAFQEASGVDLAKRYGWMTTDPKKLGLALRALVNKDDQLKHALERLDRLMEQAETIGREVRQHRKAIAETAASLSLVEVAQ